MQKVQVNIRLDEEMYQILKAQARKDGSDVCQLVRTAVYREYFKDAKSEL